MTDEQRERFDRLVDDVIQGLPEGLRALLGDVPLVVLDRPTGEMMQELRRYGVLEDDAEPTELCGLHTGVALTERSVDTEGGRLPDQVHIFREGIVLLALDGEDWGDVSPEGDEDVYEEIRVTVLHELGHHFGLDEEDLEELGYG